LKVGNPDQAPTAWVPPWPLPPCPRPLKKERKRGRGEERKKKEKKRGVAERANPVDVNLQAYID